MTVAEVITVKFLKAILINRRLICNEMGGECVAYWGGERLIQGFGAEA